MVNEKGDDWTISFWTSRSNQDVSLLGNEPRFEKLQKYLYKLW